MNEPATRTGHSDRVLRLIAIERAFRAVLLVAVGLVLVTHPSTNWASEITRAVQDLGLNPRGNGIRTIIAKVATVHGREEVLFGIVALGYGALEAVEAYGLWRRRRWGEWLTVIATSLLLVPEVWELTKGTSLLKLGALLVNIAIVAYLLWRLRRPTGEAQAQPAAG
jgi:uncharacterized membrane protein (DUF2068 family)